MNETDVIATLADLVRINSVNPNYDGGVPELKVAEYIEHFFASRGIETWRQNVLPERPNVIAHVPGRDRSRRVVLEAHMDTVSTSGMEVDPLAAELRDGMLFGRGACDTKGGLAAMMHATAAVANESEPPPCDVLLAAVIDEEYTYRGVTRFCAGAGPDPSADQPLVAEAAIVAEPTSLAPVIASKGLVRFTIRTRGRAAHSAKPHLGINAIEQMARVIIALQADTAHLANTRHPLLGCPTCNIGVIRGGEQINFVPDNCEIDIDRRMLPGESFDAVLAHYRQLLAAIAVDDNNFDAVIEPPMLTDLPLETDPDSRAVRSICRILQSLGIHDEPIGVPFCSDASKFGALGIPSIIMGPGSIDQAHASVEYVDCEQVVRAVEVYRRFLSEFC